MCKRSRLGNRPSTKPVFAEDTPQVEGKGFVAKMSKKWGEFQFNMERNRIQKKMNAMEPGVRALMAREDIENFSREERDSVAEWLRFNQNMHTLRRRKFMLDSAQRISESRKTYPTPWETRKDELEQRVEEWTLTHYPGGERAKLYAEEVKYRRAEEYSRTVQRLHKIEQSRDASSVSTEPTKVVHLEPAMPPSYKSRAATALQREGQAYLKEDRQTLDRYIDRSTMGVTLEEAMRRHPSTGVQRLKSTWRLITSRGYSTHAKPSKHKDDEEPLPKPNPNDEQFSPIPDQPPTTSYVGATRSWFQKNGPLGVTLYLSYGAIDLAIIYLLISAGVDVSSLLAAVGLETGAGAATFAVAYGLHKLLAAPRAALVVFTIPYIRPTWNKFIKFAEVKEEKIQKEVHERRASKQGDSDD